MADDFETQDTGEPDETGLAYAERLQRRIDRIEAERRRVGADDWKTLFRQMRVLCEQLAATPFILGDLEAETRLDRMLLAPDLEEFDRRVDHLADYIEAKLAYNAAVTAAQTGEPVEEAPHLRRTVSAAPGVSRMAAASGPSGSDFDVNSTTDTSDQGQQRSRRGVLRL